VETVSVKDMRGNGTLLQLAVTENKQDLVRLLLEFGVNPSATTENSTDTPMEIAALQDFPEVLKILAEFTQITDKVKLLQLYNLMDTDYVEKSKEEFQSILCSLPVDLVSTEYVYDRRIGVSRTLLLNAVCEKKLDFLRLLLEYGVDATAKADGAVSPIEFAVVDEFDEAVAILREFVKIPDDVKFVRLGRLLYHGDEEMAKKEFAEMIRTLPVDLVSRRNVDNEGTLLQAAIQRDKQDFVRILLDYGVDPTAVSEVQPHTPMEIALECRQHLEVLHILAKFMQMPDNVKHIQLALLANSADSNEASNEDFHKILNSLPLEMVSTKRPQQGGCGTILQDAVQNGKLHFVSDLLSFGVDPTAICEQKKDTPMEISVASEKSSPEMRRLLGEFTEMPNNIKLFHLSTLMATDDNKGEFRVMLWSLPVEMVSSTNVRALGSLLQGAVKEDKKDFVRTLLEFGADPNCATEGCEKTPIEIAMGVLLFEDGSYVHYRQDFEMLMVLAGFVSAETPTSTKFDILKVILERDEKSESYPEQFKKNLMDLSVSEVMEKQLSSAGILLIPASCSTGSNSLQPKEKQTTLGYF